MKKIFSIILLLTLFSLVSCKGIEFENQKIAKASEFTKGEAMIFVTEEKNKYESKFGRDIWNLKSGNGNQYFKDYVVNNVKKFVEKLMILKLTANDLNVILGNQDSDKLDEAIDEYYNKLNFNDLDFIECDKNDVRNAFYDYHISRLVIDNLSKNAETELSISEAKVIKVQYIVFDNEDDAKQTIEDLKAKGANFSYFAKTRSKDTEIEMIVKRGDELSTRFPEIFYLSSGQVSDVLQNGNRFYLFKCINDYMVDETEERRLEILKAMKNDEFNENFEKFEEKYKTQSAATYWKTIDLAEGDLCTICEFENIYYKYFPKTIK